ncbi:protein WWC2-like isoform X2 [Argonauta hians]
MPKWRNGDLSLPAGWEEGTDYDGKVFYIDHNSKKTTWIDPRDRETKPETFADCIGNELPYGWEQSFDSNIGIYYINHVTETNQLEDPRVQWREKQQEMLKEYIITAQEDLEATREIFSVKEQRLQLAQEDYKHYNEALGGWKSSHTSLNSNSSVGSTKYDPDLLKADVSHAKQRVARLKQELEQVRARVHYKEQGVETLAAVDQKLSRMDGGFTIDEAQAIMNEIKQTKKCLNTEEKQKQELMRSLARLKDDLTLSWNTGSSPDLSTLSIPLEKSSTASQTDISWELGLSSDNKLAEQTQIQLQFDELKKNFSNLKMQLVKTQSQLVPGQKESDKDRLLLLKEKEQLLRELKSIDDKGRSEHELTSIKSRIIQLERDICLAVGSSDKSISDRLKLEDHKAKIIQQLRNTSKFMTVLESQLKSTSTSQLSISSGSSLGSLGSLGSLSASSHGSLASTSMTDIYIQPQLSNESLQDLHRCVGQRLRGHSISPGLLDKDLNLGNVGAASNSDTTLSSQPTASGVSHGLCSSHPFLSRKVGTGGTQTVIVGSEHSSLSPHSSYSSLSPPTSPYDIGPPPSYEEHMNAVERHKRVAGATSTLSMGGAVDQTRTVHLTDTAGLLPLLVNNTNITTQNTSPYQLPPHMLHSVDSDCVANALQGSTISKQVATHPSVVMTATSQSAYIDNTDIASNPPLSPISETSSGVCNNLSGVNTSSVSAAVSDESVTGDSGVFEATVKRTGYLDEVLQMESAQIQITLKYDTFEGNLHVEIDQARNLGALPLPEKTKIGIKLALLPFMPVCWETKPSPDMKNPKFGESFKVAIPKNLLHAQTLQVNVWSIPDGKELECLGCAHISLADFNYQEVCVRWYNVLSFKFMQSDNLKQTVRKDPASNIDYTHLLNAVKDRIGRMSVQLSSDVRKNFACDENTVSENTKESKNVVTFGKEESSDESTIISSQTSTLTRNQGPEAMHSHEDDVHEEEDDKDTDSVDLVDSTKEQDPSIGWTSLDNYESIDPGDDIKTCEKGTNTDGDFVYKAKKRPTETVRKSTIRRSQTFSPADKQGSAYVCKLNRSDSDSSMPLYKRGPFQRNSTVRQSLRWKKLPGAAGSSLRKMPIRTSVDLELDLQASQRRLNHLRDDVYRLKELKKGMEEAKARGANELPSWLTDDENFQRLLSEADKLVHKSENDKSKQNKRAEQIMKKVTRDVEKIQKNYFPNAFREKMVFFTIDNTTVPVVPSETSADERFEEFLNDDRTGEEV